MNGEWLARWWASNVDRRTAWWNGIAAEDVVSDTGTSWWAGGP
jgi:hypothetical protein